MALTGTLQDFGITDIFQLIGQQGKSGVLHLRSEDGEEVHISFHNGAVVGAEHVGRRHRELLGRMLVRARLITEKDLSRALEISANTLYARAGLIDEDLPPVSVHDAIESDERLTPDQKRVLLDMYRALAGSASATTRQEEVS